MAGKHEHQRGPKLVPETPFREITQEFPKTRPESIVFSTDKLVLITGSAHPQLAHDTARELTKLIDAKEPIIVAETVKRFADGESVVHIPSNLRGRNVYVIQSTCPPDVERAIFQHQQMADAAGLGSAEKITAVVPYFGYARGDKKDQPRVSISAKIAANDIAEYAHRIMTVNLHAQQILGFVKRTPWDDLDASKVLLPVLQKELPPNITIVSPDMGGMREAKKYADALKAKGVATIYKQRDHSKTDHSESSRLIGDVEENVLIVDDILGTGGTLIHAVELLKERGVKRIFVSVAHGVYAGGAKELINNSDIEMVYTTDTIPQDRSDSKRRVVSVAPILARAIWCNETGDSISEYLLS